eukprot:8973453-Pyramimonas_sp.AAC.1
MQVHSYVLGASGIHGSHPYYLALVSIRDILERFGVGFEVLHRMPQHYYKVLLAAHNPGLIKAMIDLLASVEQPWKLPDDAFKKLLRG